MMLQRAGLLAGSLAVALGFAVALEFDSGTPSQPLERGIIYVQPSYHFASTLQLDLDVLRRDRTIPSPQPRICTRVILGIPPRVLLVHTSWLGFQTLSLGSIAINNCKTY